ncbi:MAG: hypothetical protein HIU93_15190 [Acidobacteria bacterium]|nr:hypothetical protein [Acidobacteriota bacterium]MBW4044331.1 hypothetical protein [Acidobacteriota bacterium]
MSVSKLASEILADMWEYGRVVLILVVFMALYGFIISKKHAQEKSNAQGGLVLIALGTVGIFALFSFLNVQGGNILALMKESPMWGVFTSSVVFLLLIVSSVTASRHFVARRKENAITITGVSEQVPRKTITGTIKLCWLVVLLLLCASAIWLWRLANG